MIRTLRDRLGLIDQAENDAAHARFAKLGDQVGLEWRKGIEKEVREVFEDRVHPRAVGAADADP